jgi:hypothetical protein
VKKATEKPVRLSPWPGQPWRHRISVGAVTVTVPWKACRAGAAGPTGEKYAVRIGPLSALLPHSSAAVSRSRGSLATAPGGRALARAPQPTRCISGTLIMVMRPSPLKVPCNYGRGA